MTPIKTLQKLGRGFLDLVFPITCLVCKTDGVYLCDNCNHKQPRLEFQECLVCQKPSPFGKTHPDCQTRNSVDGAISALTHKDRRVHEIIRVFKYNFISDLAKPLAQIIVETINAQGLEHYFSDFVIVPVPLHKRRFNWRGFNQALLLSQTLAEKLGVPIEDQLVSRQKFTQPQVHLNALERKKNLENAFTINPNASIGAKKILLVDDVVTSGSTAHELAKLLKSAKASEIWIATAAHG